MEPGGPTTPALHRAALRSPCLDAEAGLPQPLPRRAHLEVCLCPRAPPFCRPTEPGGPFEGVRSESFLNFGFSGGGREIRQGDRDRRPFEPASPQCRGPRAGCSPCLAQLCGGEHRQRPLDASVRRRDHPSRRFVHPRAAIASSQSMLTPSSTSRRRLAGTSAPGNRSGTASAGTPMPMRAWIVFSFGDGIQHDAPHVLAVLLEPEGLSRLDDRAARRAGREDLGPRDR